MEITANDPRRKSRVPIPENSDFPIQNLPFGICAVQGDKRPCSALGDYAIDLRALAATGALDSTGFTAEDFRTDVWNPLMKNGKRAIRALRNRLAEIFDAENDDPAIRKIDFEKILVPLEEVSMHLPVHVGDYTDFYSSEEHARNVGSMFRDPDNALLPNWKHLPVAYHGRSSSIVVSGTPIRRPKGQTRPDPEAPPVFGPTKLLDFELETAFITFDGKPLGEPIPIDEAADHIFGLVLFNDWSARDIQKWEYVPLGPFLAKNFASSISPWIVTLDALEPFRVQGPDQNPEVLDYLKIDGPRNLDIELEVALSPEGGKEETICRSNAKYLYWNIDQQLAHHTVNGCNIRRGDMMASGTISGKDESSYGSMLELTWRGSKPITLSDGSERKFILDGDTIIMRGYAQKGGIRVGFGEVRTKVM